MPYKLKKTKFDGALITHYCHSFPGSSGSPLFDSNGLLLGIHRASDVIENRNTAVVNYGISFPSILKRLSGSNEFYDKKSIAITNKIKESLESEVDEWSIESVLLGLPPGHEILTVEGLKRAGIERLLLKHMRNSFVNGNVDVDYPTFFGFLPNFIKIYKSHYGKNQIQHAMLTDGIAKLELKKQNSEMRQRLFSYFDRKVDNFIAMDKIDEVQAAREFGHIIHTVQDSYSRSHTKRDSQGIVSFFHYKTQNKDNHSKLDKIFNEEDQYTEYANYAIDQTTILFVAAYTESEYRKKNILDVLHDVFKLSEEHNPSDLGNIESIQKSVPFRGELESLSFTPATYHKFEFNSPIKAVRLSGNIIHRPIEGDECCPPPTYTE